MNKKTKRTLTPKRRFPEFRQRTGWGTGTMADIAKVLQGYGFPDKHQGLKCGEYPFYKVSDISNSLRLGKVFIEESANYVDAGLLKTLRAKPIPEGTTIFAKIGEAIRSNRRVVTTRPCLIDNNAAGVKMISGKSTDLFMYFLMETIQLIDYAGGVVPAVNKSAIENISIAYPEVPEQKKIADCLSSLDEMIAAEGRKLEALRAHKKGLMQQLFPRPGETRPRHRFPEFRNAPEWEERPLNDCFSRIRNGFVGTATPYYVPDGIPYLQGKNVKSGRIDPTALVRISKAFHDKQKKSQLRSTDVLMVQSGHVGECAVVGQKYAGANCHALLVMTPKEQQDSFYFVHCFRSDYGKRFIRKITTGNTIKHILASDMNAMTLRAPTFAEQQRIAACLSSLDDVLAAQVRKVEGLKTHKKGLMQQIFPSPKEDDVISSGGAPTS